MTGLLAFVKSDIGLSRKINEDSYIFAPPDLFAVADGMGGHEAGEVASSLAVDAICKHIEASRQTAEAGYLLEEAIIQANKQIFQMAQSKAECAGMGTTVTAIYIQEDRIYWGHVGDSRLYLLRDGRLMQVTRDHSLVGELLQNGSITPEQAQNHPHRNILTRAVGTAEDLQVDCDSLVWEPGDLLLICSDGLTGLVSDEEILSVLVDTLSLEEKADLLVDKALAAGGFDNITVILAQCGA